ncbi:MAG: aldehyde dehydrogenase family protein, partial [Bryobacterales bacterium]|nr:aldehyde dehydrogenase family protein [Bryobacterales bacterium]
MQASGLADTSTKNPFTNEPYADFTKPTVASVAIDAYRRVEASTGREHALWLDGAWVSRDKKFESLDPSHPQRVVSRHSSATMEDAERALASANASFPEWSRTTPEDRAAVAFAAARLMRQRKMEFDALLVIEAGKNWVEAEADVSEAIDFCEYYGREAIRLGGSHPTTPLPGERTEMFYLPLGTGVIIPPWNFPLAILCGMTVAALAAGNTVVLKPSSDTPLIAVRFVELLLEAGLPPQAIQLLTGSGATIGDALVRHPKTRFISFTGSKAVGLRVNELAAITPPGQIWINRAVEEMGRKGAIVV